MLTDIGEYITKQVEGVCMYGWADNANGENREKLLHELYRRWQLDIYERYGTIIIWKQIQNN